MIQIERRKMTWHIFQYLEKRKPKPSNHNHNKSMSSFKSNPKNPQKTVSSVSAAEKQWRSTVLIMSRHCEVSLFRHATSLEDYANLATLPQRLKYLVLQQSSSNASSRNNNPGAITTTPSTSSSSSTHHHLYAKTKSSSSFLTSSSSSTATATAATTPSQD
ncbi:hypothetical protein ACA910_000093 [Epithemia clementina (nom. ined.)]